MSEFLAQFPGLVTPLPLATALVVGVAFLLGLGWWANRPLGGSNTTTKEPGEPQC